MKLNIEKRKFQPSAKIENGRFTIEGTSMLDDCEGFYYEVLAAFQKYAKKPEQDTEIEFYFDIIDCKSKRHLMDLINKSEEFYQKGNNLKINWKFGKEDEAMKENGEIIQSLVKVPFQLVEC